LTKSAVATYSGTGLRFTARSGSGHEMVMDNKEGDTGPRPMELILVGQAGCTAMDVMSILQKKRQEVTSYEVAVSAAEHEGNPAYYTRADVVHVVEGPAVEEAAVRRAVELSATKYCSVAAMLSAGTVEIHHRYRIVRPDLTAPIEGEVLVTGPHADPDALGAAMPAGVQPAAH
jgi:putative redox protein